MQRSKKTRQRFTSLISLCLFIAGVLMIATAGMLGANIFLDDPNGLSGRYTPQSVPESPPLPQEDITFKSTVQPTDNTKNPLIVVKSGAGEGIVTSSSAGIDCGSICTAYFASETTVELKAIPLEGNIFKGWEGSEDCVDGIVAMEGLRTCTAIFEPASHQQNAWQYSPDKQDVYWLEGNMGVGTNIPQKKLEVAGSIKGEKICIGEDCREKWPESKKTESAWQKTGNNDVYTVSNVGIGMDAPIYPLQVKGHAWVMRFLVAEKFFRFSDQRLKQNIRPLQDSLRKILALQGVEFEWIDPAKEAGDQIGLIAQEVEQVFPEFVTDGPDGMKTVDYSGLVVPLIEAVKEQENRIRTLEMEMAKVRGGDEKCEQ